jgi:D-threonine aldolase
VSLNPRAQVSALGRTAAAAGVAIDVLPEVDVGQHRCGVTSREALLELVDAIATEQTLRFAAWMATMVVSRGRARSR